MSVEAPEWRSWYITVFGGSPSARTAAFHSLSISFSLNLKRGSSFGRLPFRSPSSPPSHSGSSMTTVSSK
eukprot:14258692-Heterocapsa_arctica.AAC.1